MKTLTIPNSKFQANEFAKIDTSNRKLADKNQERVLITHRYYDPDSSKWFYRLWHRKRLFREEELAPWTAITL